MPSPINVTRWPRRTALLSRSVTSTAIRSIETRPAIGQRLPATTTSAPRGPSLALAAREKDPKPGGPARGPGAAIADGFAAIDVADLHDARLEVDHLLHRVVGLRRRVDAVERAARPHDLELELATEEHAGG